MLTLFEELFLLSLHEKKSIELSNDYTLRYGLAGAILAELIEMGRISIDDKKRVALRNDALTGQDLLDEALMKIKDSVKEHKLAYWIDHLSCGKKEQMKLISALEQKGVLRQEEKRFLWVIPYTVLPDMDASAKYALKERLRRAVLTQKTVDTREMILISLMKACQMLDHLFTRDEIKSARRKVEQLVKDELLGSAVTELIAEIEAASAAAVVAIAP